MKRGNIFRRVELDYIIGAIWNNQHLGQTGQNYMMSTTGHIDDFVILTKITHNFSTIEIEPSKTEFASGS